VLYFINNNTGYGVCTGCCAAPVHTPHAATTLRYL